MNINAIQNTENTNQAAATERNTTTSASGFSNYMDQAGGTSSLDQIFDEAANTYQVPKELLKAVAKAESNFNAKAVSSCGAMGIMQLMPATASALGVTNAYDPKQNIMGGAKYLSQLLDKYKGNVSYAVAAYNAGGGNVDKYGGIPPFKETRAYVTKVLQFLDQGVEIPNEASGTQQTSSASAASSAYAASPASAQQEASGATDPLQKIMEKYFDYEDYLEFLQLFTKIIYEKISGKELEDTEKTDSEKEDVKEAAEQEDEKVKEPQKVLTMTVRDSYGRSNTYQQGAGADSDAQRAYMDMTSGGTNRLAVVLNRTAE